MRRIAVLDAPSNLGLRPPTATSVPGCAKAPGALRDHGLLTKLGARDAGCLTPPRYDPGDWRPGDGVAQAEQIAAYSRKLADRIGAILDAGEFPVILGGDCSILLGSGLAMHRLGEAVGGRIGLVFVDGHSDFRHPGNASYVGAAAGEDLALVTGRGQADLASIEGRRPYFRDIDVVVLGLRAQDEYRLDLQAAGIVTRPVPALRVEGAARSAQWARDQLVDCAGYWLHVDVDVLDPAVMPAVDAPTPGGIAFPELEILLAGLVESPHCLGVEITVFDPDYDPDGAYAAEIATTVAAGLAAARTVALRPDLIAARADLAKPAVKPVGESAWPAAEPAAPASESAARAARPAVGPGGPAAPAVGHGGPAARPAVGPGGPAAPAVGPGGPAAPAVGPGGPAAEAVGLAAEPAAPAAEPAAPAAESAARAGEAAAPGAGAAAPAAPGAEPAPPAAEAAADAIEPASRGAEPEPRPDPGEADLAAEGGPEPGHVTGSAADPEPAPDASREASAARPAVTDAAAGLASLLRPSADGDARAALLRPTGDVAASVRASLLRPRSKAGRQSLLRRPAEGEADGPSSLLRPAAAAQDAEETPRSTPVDDLPAADVHQVDDKAVPGDKSEISVLSGEERAESTPDAEADQPVESGPDARAVEDSFIARPLGQAPLLDSKPLPATRPGMLRPRPADDRPADDSRAEDLPAADGFSLPVQRPAFDLGSGSPADIA